MWNVAIPVRDDIFLNNSIDLRIFASLMLISNRENNLKGCSEKNERYLYDNKLEEKKNYILDLLGFKYQSLKRHMAILMDHKIIKPKNSEKGIIYKLIYRKGAYKKDDTQKNKLEFVLINNLELEYLIKSCNAREFKLYCFLKRECGSIWKPITQDVLCKGLGFSVYNKKNIITSIKKLENINAITSQNIKGKYQVVENNKVKVAFTNYITYKITHPKVSINE